MKKILPIIIVGIVVLAAITGVVVYKTLTAKPTQKQSVIEEQQQTETLPQVDSSVQILLTKSPNAANTVILSVKGMASKMKSISYELTFDSQGISQGVTGKDVDVTGKDAFERSIYLGTCSKNDCRPYPGVTKVSVTLVFTDISGTQSQFTKDYPL